MNRSMRTLNGNVFGRICGVCAVLGVIGLIVASAWTSNVSANVVKVQIDASSTSLEMEMDSTSIVLNTVPSVGGNFNSEDFNITVGTNSQYGYSLKMMVDPTLSGALERTEALQSGTKPTISEITATPGGYTQAQIEADSNLNNTWAYKCTICSKAGVDASTNYLPVPTTPTEIASTNASGNSNTTTLTFGAKVDTDTIEGTYGTTISFAAVVNNPGTVTSINQLEYMQQFATLSSAEKSNVKASMVQDSQYTLKDNRDEKVYYVAKLADGNVWMTQNLDHDIVSTTDFYTYYNTDLGRRTSTPDTSATWTGVATRITSDLSWSGSKVSPESYDPGEICWNGVIAATAGEAKNRANGTEPCVDGVNMNYHVGNYYNWTAAVAMTDSSDYTTYNQVVNQSICPAGWMLPELSYLKTISYKVLVETLGLTSGLSGNIQEAPVYFTYTGGKNGGAEWGYGFYMLYWMSRVPSVSNGYQLRAYGDSLWPEYTLDRSQGTAVRCAVRK